MGGGVGDDGARGDLATAGRLGEPTGEVVAVARHAVVLNIELGAIFIAIDDAYKVGCVGREVAVAGIEGDVIGRSKVRKELEGFYCRVICKRDGIVKRGVDWARSRIDDIIFPITKNITIIGGGRKVGGIHLVRQVLGYGRARAARPGGVVGIGDVPRLGDTDALDSRLDRGGGKEKREKAQRGNPRGALQRFGDEVHSRLLPDGPGGGATPPWGPPSLPPPGR